MFTIKYPLVLIVTFLWIGFVCAISFLEAWLKFRAPGVTLPIGLGIGRLVFSALNKIEWVFVSVIIVNIIFSKTHFFTITNLPLVILLILLIIQTFWLLPLLDARAELHIQELPVPSSHLHFYYVGTEIIKIASLTVFGITLFNKI